MLNSFECDARATERALAEDPDSSAFWLDAGRCRVYGRTGNEYTVRLIGDPTRTAGYSCDCKAGENGRLCWHVAAAKIRRETSAACRPAKPAAKVWVKPATIVCPECAGTIDPTDGRCLTGYLFGNCDYRQAVIK